MHSPSVHTLAIDLIKAWKGGNILTYLDRMGLSSIDLSTPSLELLTALCLGHLRTIPFETLDTHFELEVRLDMEAIYTKIVTRRRGGFCIELIALFSWLLLSLGFCVRLVLCHVWAADVAKEGGFRSTPTHLCAIASLPGDPDAAWLVDVSTLRERERVC